MGNKKASQKHACALDQRQRHILTEASWMLLRFMEDLDINAELARKNLSQMAEIWLRRGLVKKADWKKMIDVLEKTGVQNAQQTCARSV